MNADVENASGKTGSIGRMAQILNARSAPNAQ